MSVSGIGGAAAHQVHSRSTAPRPPPKGAGGGEKGSSFLASVASAQTASAQTASAQTASAQTASVQTDTAATAVSQTAGTVKPRGEAGGVAAPSASGGANASVSLTNAPATAHPSAQPRPERQRQHQEGDTPPPAQDNRLAGNERGQEGAGAINHQAFRAYTPAPQARSTTSLVA